MPNWKKVIVSGSDASLRSVSASNQSTFDAGITVNGTNSTLYNNVAFIDLNGVSGSRIDLHGKNSINSISTDVNDLSIIIPSGSAIFEVDKGSFEIYASQSIYLSSDVTSSANILVSGSVLIGTSSFTQNNNERLLIDSGVTNSYNLITARTNVNNYAQFNITNKNTGSSASTDIVATNNIGTEGTYYVDLGINGSNFVGAVGEANDAYLYTTGSNLLIGNITTGKDVKLFTSGGFVEITSATKMTGSLLVSGSSTISGSFNVSGSTLQTGNNTLIGNTILSGSVNISGSTIITGTTNFSNSTSTITGSLLVSGSTTQIGNNTLTGNTLLSGSLIVSGSQGLSTATIGFFGDVDINGTLGFLPVSANINTALSGSYIYVSGSTQDLYFSQNGSGYNNVTRLRWIEGNLYTGLLNGGLIGSSSSTVYTVQSGSGIIVSLNASIADNPYPTIKYLNWGTLSASIAPQTGSYDQTFVGLDDTGNIYAQGTPFVNGQFNTLIPLGIVLHQNRSTINGTKTQPSVGYGIKQRQNAFIRAFGPLKLSGHTLITSSSLGLLVGSGTSYSDGANYQIDPNNPSYVTDPGISVSKIFRYHQSGSAAWVYNTNAGAGFTVIDPAQYSNNGTLAAVGNSEWSIQRVFHYPNSVTKAVVVYYGNAKYTTEAEAIANINIESFVEAPNTAANAIYLGAFVIKGNGVFTTEADFTLLPGGLFRQVGGSGGGGSAVTQTLAGLSDVSITGPTDHQPFAYSTTAGKWINQSSISASLKGNADTATSASYALTSSYSNKSTLADSATTASYVLNAISSSFALNAQTASFIRSLNQNITVTGSITATGDIITQGNIIAQQYIVSSSVAYFTESFSSGSTKFGNSADDTHQFTGSVSILGSLNANLTGSVLGTGSYALSALSSSYAIKASSADSATNASTASYVLQAVSASFATTASYSNKSSLADNATNASTASYVLNAVSASFATTASYSNKTSLADNATNASTASYILNAVSASFATNANLLDNLDSTAFAQLASANTFTNNQIISGSLTVFTGSGIEFQVLNTGVKIGNLISDAHTITGSVGVSGSVTATTFSGAGSFSTLTSTSTTTLASSTGTQTIALGAGATTAVATKTINIGTAGVSGSTTNVNIGSAVVGAVGTITLNENTILSGSLTVFTGSVIEFQVTNTGTKIGNLISDIHTITGSVDISGSVTAVGFTGPLTGTASYASQALNASTASYVVTANTASYVLQAVSASFATTASYSNKSSLADNATNATNATTASYVLQAVSSSFATNASTASYIATASYALSALSSSYAINASSANTALTASYVSLAQTASYANFLDGYDSTDFARLAAANRFTTNQVITGSLTATGDIITQGNIVAQQYIVSSSVAYFTESFSSGSTKFGNSLDDTHQFTGSVNITGSVTITGNQLITGSLTVSGSNNTIKGDTTTIQGGPNTYIAVQDGLIFLSDKTNITQSLSVGNITGSGISGRIDATNDVVAFSTSDIRFKENIYPINNALDKIDEIGGYTFDWKTDEELVSLHGHSGHDVGVIAHEIESILPEIVTTRDNGYKAVKYEKIVPLLIQAIKELKAEVDSLKAGNYNKLD